MGMTRTVTRTRVPSALRATAAAVLMATVVAACGSSSSTPAAPGQATNAPTVSAAASVPAVQPPAASAAAPSAAAPSAAAARTADPVLANALAQLNALTSYQFKFTLKGGSYASSVGPAGVAGTVVNKPTFAVQFTYVDLEVIEIHGKNWTKNGSSWDLSRYPDLPTTYDSYGPAILLAHYFTASSAASYTSAGDETVNGVPATHYTADPKSLSYMTNYWGVTAASGQLAMTADIWIAKSGGYPVRWKVASPNVKVVPGSGGSTVFEFLVDITKANDPGNVIAVPAS
jgi:hypothetical protein